jgi:opacity protein-like surface antigen
MRGCKIFMIAIFCLTFGALQAGAQFLSEPKFEITPFGGTRFGGQISYNPPATYTGPGAGSGGELLDYIKLKSSFDYGVEADYALFPGFEAEFLWSRQPTELRAHNAESGGLADIGSANLDNYNGGALWELKGEESKIKPFISFGLGFTHFGTNGVLTGINNRFSYNIGGGVKYEPTAHVGLRVDVRYSPTHTTQQVGYGEDFYGDLYQTEITNKANQGQANIGVIFRF